VLQSVDLVQGNVENISVSALIVGTISSALFGYLAVKWMIDYLKKHSLKVFAVYVWILGFIVIAFQTTGKF
jgi:undecaprenyl-diphosphatase